MRWADNYELIVNTYLVEGTTPDSSGDIEENFE